MSPRVSHPVYNISSNLHVMSVFDDEVLVEVKKTGMDDLLPNPIIPGSY